MQISKNFSPFSCVSSLNCFFFFKFLFLILILKIAFHYQNLNIGIASESASLPLNFCHGESSSNPEHSQEFTQDQKPVVSAGGTFEPQEDQFLIMPEQYAIDSKTVKDGHNGEASHDGNPLNFNYPLDELYLESINDPLVGDGSFLETNDLSNPIEPDPNGIDMLEEYLTYFDADDDISKYISFDTDDAPLQGPPFTEQVRAYSRYSSLDALRICLIGVH